MLISFGKEKIKLPKHVTVEHNGRKIYFGPEFTALSARQLKKHRLVQEEIDEFYIISKDLQNQAHCNERQDPLSSPARGIDYDAIRNNPLRENGAQDEFEVVSNPNLSNALEDTIVDWTPEVLAVC